MRRIVALFVIDVFARRIVGWKAPSSMQTDFVLDTLEQALYASASKPVVPGRLIHHSDRGVRSVSIRYTERLAEAGLEPSVGSVGGRLRARRLPSGHNPLLAETINGLYTAEVIHRKPSWRTRKELEWATRNWVDWFNNCRLPEPIGNIPPAEAEANDSSHSPECVMSA